MHNVFVFDNIPKNIKRKTMKNTFYALYLTILWKNLKTLAGFNNTLNVSSPKVRARQVGLKVSAQTNYAPTCLAPTLPANLKGTPLNGVQTIWIIKMRSRHGVVLDVFQNQAGKTILQVQTVRNIFRKLGPELIEVDIAPEHITPATN